MKRILLLLLVGIIGIVAYGVLFRMPSQISLLDAKAFAAPGVPSMYMVELSIENQGDADVLLGVASPAAEMITLVNSGHADRPIMVPAADSGILAMDGAHVMLRADGFEPGGFIPITLTFESAGAVTTRVQNAGVSGMTHDAAFGVSVVPVPEMTLRRLDRPGANGFTGQLDTENFHFERLTDPAAHVPGQGHAHLYLNGLKLRRLYAPVFTIGGLRPGTHVLEVVLNTNDHRTYLGSDGSPIRARLELTIDR